MSTFIYRMVPLATALTVLFSTAAFAHDDVWPGEKLKKLVPEALSFEQHNLYLSQTQQQNIELELGVSLPREDLEPSIYMAVTRAGADAEPLRTAAIVFVDAVVPHGIVELGVVVDREGALLGASVFAHDENAVEVPNEALNDLKGLQVGQPLPEPEVDRLGAEQRKAYLAARAGVQRGLVLINEIFGH